MTNEYLDEEPPSSWTNTQHVLSLKCYWCNPKDWLPLNHWIFLLGILCARYYIFALKRWRNHIIRRNCLNLKIQIGIYQYIYLFKFKCLLHLQCTPTRTCNTCGPPCCVCVESAKKIIKHLNRIRWMYLLYAVGIEPIDYKEVVKNCFSILGTWSQITGNKSLNCYDCGSDVQANIMSTFLFRLKMFLSCLV